MYKVEVLRYDDPEQLLERLKALMNGSDKLVVCADNTIRDEVILVGGARPGEEPRQRDIDEANKICAALNA